MNIKAQIAAFEAKRAQIAARNSEILNKSAEEGATLDADQKVEYDDNAADIAEIDDHIKRLKSALALESQTAEPVSGENTKSGVDARAVIGTGIKIDKAPDAGIRFARYAKCLAISTKTNQPIASVAEQIYGKVDSDFVDQTKAAVSAMTTANTGALIGNVGGWADFVEFLRPRTILGRFGQNGIPSLTSVPFRVPLITEDSESEANWVGEGKGKPVTRFTVGRTILEPLKVATISVQTMELIRDSSPNSDVLLRNSLANSIAKRLDQTFITPATAPVAGVSPGSIINGVTATAGSAATDADGARADAEALLGTFIASNNDLTTGVWIMSGTTALKLMSLRNPLGQREFPEMTLAGGTFYGLPAIVSNYVGDYLALVNAADIYVGDEGGLEIAMSTEASLEMETVPTQDVGAAAPVAAELVSMFQTNAVAFRAERAISWKRRRAGAVAWVNNLAWSGAAPSGG